MKIDESFDNKSVTISVGDLLELSLAENPTTGFRWTIASSGAPICALKADDFAPAGQKPGEGGRHNFTFQVGQAGEAKIALHSGRQWGDSGAGHDFTLNVRATAPS
jgi:inhibitor of cysteine peptidase